jgi:flagella basal body P-ring formation protein FlgA
MVAVGGLSAAYAVTLVGSTQAYLAVARTVHVGAALTPADVSTVRITADPPCGPSRPAGSTRCSAATPRSS